MVHEADIASRFVGVIPNVARRTSLPRLRYLVQETPRRVPHGPP